MTTIRSAYINDQIDPTQRKTTYTNSPQQPYGNQSPHYANDPTHGPYNYQQGPAYPQGYAPPPYPYGNGAYYGSTTYDPGNHAYYPYGAAYYPYAPQGYAAGYPYQGTYPYAYGYGYGYGSQAYSAYPYGLYNPASYAPSQNTYGRPYSYESRGKEEPLHTILKDLYRIYEDSHKGMPQSGYTIPVCIDLREDETAYYVTAEIPGVAIKDYELYYNEGVLTIRGEKKAYAYDRYEDKAYDTEEKKYYTLATERPYGPFLRQIPLQGAVYADKIEARYINGILYVTLPKQGGDYTKGKKINIWTTGT